MVCKHSSFLCGGFLLLFYFAYILVRKSISFILLFCLLIYVGGYHLLYMLYQQGLKTEMKAYIKETHSSKFGSKFIFPFSNGKIEDTSFSWEEENQEFRYHQELYDVISAKKTNDTIEIICLKDTDENFVESQMNEIHKLNKSDSSKSSQNNFKFFSPFYIQRQISKETTFLEKNKIPYQFSSNLVFHVFDIQSPPPRC